MFIQPVGQVADKDYFYILNYRNVKGKNSSAVSEAGR